MNSNLVCFNSKLLFAGEQISHAFNECNGSTPLSSTGRDVLRKRVALIAPSAVEPSSIFLKFFANVAVLCALSALQASTWCPAEKASLSHTFHSSITYNPLTALVDCLSTPSPSRTLRSGGLNIVSAFDVCQEACAFSSNSSCI
jgi:hypothetical protein